MQGNLTKLKSLFFILLLLLVFSSTSFASNQVGGKPTNVQLSVQQSAERIHINKASAEQLSSLPGIGHSKAAAIITARDTKGSFTSTADLLAIKGIGEKTVARLESFISF